MEKVLSQVAGTETLCLIQVNTECGEHWIVIAKIKIDPSSYPRLTSKRTTVTSKTITSLKITRGGVCCAVIRTLLNIPVWSVWLPALVLSSILDDCFLLMHTLEGSRWQLKTVRILSSMPRTQAEFLAPDQVQWALGEETSSKDLLLSASLSLCASSSQISTF